MTQVRKKKGSSGWTEFAVSHGIQDSRVTTVVRCSVCPVVNQITEIRSHMWHSTRHCCDLWMCSLLWRYIQCNRAHTGSKKLGYTGRYTVSARRTPIAAYGSLWRPREIRFECWHLHIRSLRQHGRQQRHNIKLCVEKSKSKLCFFLLLSRVAVQCCFTISWSTSHMIRSMIVVAFTHRQW